MKRLLPTLCLLAFSGCAIVHTTTSERPNTSNTNRPLVVTTMTAYTLFDANSELTKLSVRGTVVKTNEWPIGTYIGQLGQNSSSTNLNDIIGAVVGAAVRAAIKP